MDRKYPIGTFDYQAEVSDEQLQKAIEDIKSLPKRIEHELYYAEADQLNSPYREGGWTVKQVVHHLGDSHMNALVRFKLTLTEDNPTIKPYDENSWSEMADYVKLPIQDAVEFLKIIHAKWAAILDDMYEADFDRTFIHPEGNYPASLRGATALYAWHGNHHLAHIQLVTKNNK